MKRKFLFFLMIIFIGTIMISCGKNPNGVNDKTNEVQKVECDHLFGEVSCMEAPKCTKCGEVNGSA